MLHVLPILALVLFAFPAAAASSRWIESEGGAVRLVTSGLADEAGHLRGALEIRLEPGWKTYWRDPGEAGVPPQIDVSASPEVTAARIFFPPPERIRDQYATWAGYTRSVTLPVIFQLTTPGSAGVLEGNVFLGICETICIPLQADFSFDAGADPDNPADALLVSTAFAALPEEARDGFRVSQVVAQGDRLRFHAEIPRGAGEPALFVAAPAGARFSVPTIEARDGARATFTLQVLDAQDAETPLDYTLVHGERAVNGTVPFP